MISKNLIKIFALDSRQVERSQVGWIFYKDNGRKLWIVPTL